MSRILRFTVPRGAELPASPPIQPETAEQAVLEAKKANQNNRPSEAITLLQGALALDPHHEDAVIELGLTLYDVGRGDEALEVVVKALDANPSLLRARLCHGNLLLRRQELERAAEELERCLEQSPTWEPPYAPLISALCRLGRIDQARSALKNLRSMSLDPAQLEMLSKLIERSAASITVR